MASAAAAAKLLQLCPTLCDPIDGSPRGSPISGILQARTLGWVAISFSSAWKWKVKVKALSRVQPSVTPWTAAHQAPPSMGFSRQEYWSGVPLPSPYGKWDMAFNFLAKYMHFLTFEFIKIKRNFLLTLYLGTHYIEFTYQISLSTTQMLSSLMANNYLQFARFSKRCQASISPGSGAWQWELTRVVVFTGRGYDWW